MVLDSIIPATIAVPLLGMTGALLIRASHRGRACPALSGVAWDNPRNSASPSCEDQQDGVGEPTPSCLGDWGLGLVASAIGLAMGLAAPDAILSPMGVLGQAASIFGSGLIWSGARRLGRGTAPRPTAAAAGALVWLGVSLAVAPTLGWRIAIGSALLAAYNVAAAHELMRNRSRRVDAQRAGGLVLAAYGAVWALRALLGAAFGVGALGLIGLGTLPFAVLFGALALAMNRQDGGQTARDETLEDALTGVGNHRALTGSGVALMAAAAAAGRPLALLVMDLDGFAGVNDRQGAEAADRLLVAFASLAHAYLPPTSLVCRLGGDIFAAVLPGAEPDRARAVADELRSLFAHLEIEGPDGPIAATVSIGVAQARPGRTLLRELLGAADNCLSAAKHAGRDRVLHEAELPGAGWLSAA